MVLALAEECCICYEGGPQVRVLSCKHSICTDCCRKIRSTCCPMCRKDIEDALLLELRIVRIRRLGAYSFYMALPLMAGDDGADFFSTEHYPVGFSQDFELCVPPSVLRLAIERVNLQIASVDLSLQTAQCCGWSASMLARHRVTRAVNELNEEWRFANIPCYLSLSPGWALTQSTLYVQWDPDRDVI
ncbi:rngB [Symbiodinium natans]|uniref:RngB protein n=1 Tax=Symbiodinium natans TaxID=878477 RepID=A0A812PR81_9DINO|nr:rngB [Symbiodinium natans]